MGVGDLWTRTLVYFGIAEEDEEWADDDENGYRAEESLERSYRERPNVRRLTPRRRGQDFEDWTESDEEQATAAVPDGAAPNRGGAEPELRPRPSRPAAELQRRAADRRQVQAVDPGHPQPPERGHGAVEAADRLLERPHLRTERRHAARRRQGLPADAPERRGVGRAARPADRTRRFLQPGLTATWRPACRRRARRRTRSGEGEGRLNALAGRDRERADVRVRLRDRLQPHADRLHHHVVDPDAVLAQRGSAVPLRRVRALPALVAAPAAVLGRAARLVADHRPPRTRGRGEGRDRALGTAPLERRRHGVHTGRAQARALPAQPVSRVQPARRRRAVTGRRHELRGRVARTGGSRRPRRDAREGAGRPAEPRAAARDDARLRRKGRCRREGAREARGRAHRRGGAPRGAVDRARRAGAPRAAVRGGTAGGDVAQ